jgi:hypothetical protein
MFFMKKILLICMVLISMSAISQEILFSQDVKSDTVIPTKGPNLKNFVHPYFAFSFPFFTNEDVKFIKPWSSSIVDFGYRYKRKLSKNLAVGLDLSVNWASYKIKQEDGKFIPDSTKNDKEKLQVNSLSPAVYARINVGKRGNFIGNYLDLGGFFSWNWKTMHKTTNTDTDDQKVQVHVSNLQYMEKISYGVLARIGTNRYAFTARYRMSDLFTESFNKPELPRLSVGFEIGLLK